MPVKQKADHIERHKYACHKSKAKHRGIEFKLTYEQWWSIWQQSGKWEQRGPGIGQYVMSRINDKGAYEIGNVFIQPASENKQQGNIGLKRPRTAEHQNKITNSLNTTFNDPSYVSPQKGRSKNWDPEKVKQGRIVAGSKLSIIATGRKRKYNDDGTWNWYYPGVS